MISKVDELRELLGPDMSGFVGHLQNIARVHEVSNSKDLDIDEARAMLDQFVATSQVFSSGLKVVKLRQHECQKECLLIRQQGVM